MLGDYNQGFFENAKKVFESFNYILDCCYSWTILLPASSKKKSRVYKKKLLTNVEHPLWLSLYIKRCSSRDLIEEIRIIFSCVISYYIYLFYQYTLGLIICCHHWFLHLVFVQPLVIFRLLFLNQMQDRAHLMLMYKNKFHFFPSKTLGGGKKTVLGIVRRRVEDLIKFSTAYRQRKKVQYWFPFKLLSSNNVKT